MESHKVIIPCERCANSSKLHQIKTHLMTPLVICCKNTCVSENLWGFLFTKCRIHVKYQNLNSFFFHVHVYWINHIVFIRFIISLFIIVFDYIM